LAVFLICYDIESENKRGKMRKKLKNVGLHVQWSAFHVEANNIGEVISFVKERIELNESFTVFRVKRTVAKIGTDWEEPVFRV